MDASARLREPRYSSPLYTEAEAARVLGLPASTLRSWTHPLNYKTVGGYHERKALVTTAARPFRGKTIPFVGLAEAFVLSAFRRTGVPMQRIRPALPVLEERFGLVAALMSERLKSDGAEVLYEYGLDPSLDDDFVPEQRDLVVVRNGQRLFAEVVEDQLKTIVYSDGIVKSLRLPAWADVDVVADPDLNAGQPTIASRGIRVADLLSRSAAGDTVADLADDYRLAPDYVRQILAA